MLLIKCTDDMIQLWKHYAVDAEVARWCRANLRPHVVLTCIPPSRLYASVFFFCICRRHRFFLKLHVFFRYILPFRSIQILWAAAAQSKCERICVKSTFIVPSSLFIKWLKFLKNSPHNIDEFIYSFSVYFSILTCAPRGNTKWGNVFRNVFFTLYKKLMQHKMTS